MKTCMVMLGWCSAFDGAPNGVVLVQVKERLCGAQEIAKRYLIKCW